MRHLENYKIFENTINEVCTEVDDIYMYVNEVSDFMVSCGYYGMFGGYFRVRIRKIDCENETYGSFKSSELNKEEEKLFQFMNKINFSFEEIEISKTLNCEKMRNLTKEQFKLYKNEEIYYLEYVFLTGARKTL
jgi:hypothetical protein